MGKALPVESTVAKLITFVLNLNKSIGFCEESNHSLFDEILALISYISIIMEIVILYYQIELDLIAQ